MGGLRDLHALRWIARAVFGDGAPDTLVAHGVFTLAQARDYERAEAFLLVARLHLHCLSGRAEEHLTFDKQIEIATAMGLPIQRPSKALKSSCRLFSRGAMVGTLTGLMIATIEEARPATQLVGLASDAQA